MTGSEVMALARGCRTYRQMAAECGVAKSELHAIETRNISPRVITVQKICAVASNGVSALDFINAEYLTNK